MQVCAIVFQCCVEFYDEIASSIEPKRGICLDLIKYPIISLDNELQVIKYQYQIAFASYNPNQSISFVEVHFAMLAEGNNCSIS